MPQDSSLAVEEKRIDILLAGQLERLTEGALVQVEGDGPLAGDRIGDAGPHPLVDERAGQNVESLNGRQFIVAHRRIGLLKLPGEWDPRVDLALLPLLERDQDQVQFALKIFWVRFK